MSDGRFHSHFVYHPHVCTRKCPPIGSLAAEIELREKYGMIVDALRGEEVDSPAYQILSDALERLEVHVGLVEE
jgi:hypothetical protein